MIYLTLFPQYYVSEYLDFKLTSNHRDKIKLGQFSFWIFHQIFIVLSRYHYCEKCFMEMEGDTVTLEDAVVENRFVPIVDFRTLPEK